MQAKRTSDGPMENQSVIFSKETFATRAEAVKWLEDHPNLTKKKGEGASVVDLEHLERYVVINTGEVAPADVEDIRELEGDFGHGVYPLWSDAKQSIVAFAFEPGMFTREQAEQWMKNAAMEAPATLSVRELIGAVLAPFARAFGKGRPPEGQALISFDEIRRRISAALDKAYPAQKDISGNYTAFSPWIVEIGTSQVVVEMPTPPSVAPSVPGEPSKRYMLSYSFSPDGAVLLGDPVEVTQGWVKADGTPVMLYAFSAHLGDGVEAEGEDDGLLWKEIIHPGKWFKTDSGRVVEVTKEMIASAFQAWQAGLPKHISVPSDDHHERASGVVPAEHNRGFVQQLKMIGDRVFGGFKLTPQAAAGVRDGSIADVSVYMQPSVIHPETGEQFDWAFRHVLLTNDPLVQDLEPFGASPVGASANDRGVIVELYQEVDMSNQQGTQGGPTRDQQTPPAVTLGAEDLALLEGVKGLGLSAADVKAMADERAAVRQKARGLEITRVIRAMEGAEQHPGVVQITGTRHWPVVCAAVEEALLKQPAALALSADGDGHTILDAVVLGIINALPAEARMTVTASVAEPPKQRDGSKPPAGDPTDEQINEFSGRLGGGGRGVTATVK